MVNAARRRGHAGVRVCGRDETTANFGVEEFATDLSRTHQLTVKNDGTSPVTFNVSVTNKAGSPHTVTVNRSTDHGAAAWPDDLPRHDADGAGRQRRATRTRSAMSRASSRSRRVGGSNKGIDLKVPYYIVPRVSSNVAAALAIPKKSDTGVVAVTNQASPIGATADFYAWGLEDVNDKLGRFDVRAAGVQSFSDWHDRCSR